MQSLSKFITGSFKAKTEQSQNPLGGGSSLGRSQYITIAPSGKWNRVMGLMIILAFLLGGCTSEEEIRRTALHYFKDGNRYYSQSDFQNAIWNFQKAIILDSDTPEFHFNLGLAYYEIGNYPEALEAYMRVMELRPELSDTYFNIALAYYRMENSRQADRYYGQYQEMLSLRKSRERAREKLMMSAREKTRAEEDALNAASAKTKNAPVNKTKMSLTTSTQKMQAIQTLKRPPKSIKFSNPQRRGLNTVPQWD